MNNPRLSVARFVVTLTLVAAITGCECIKENSFTGRLWNSDDFRHFRGLSTNAPVALYRVPAQDDYLIVYTEVRDGDDQPQSRAFYLRENAEALENHQKPRFVATNAAGLQSIPLTTNGVLRATVSSNIVVYTENGFSGPYPLSEYESTAGTGTKVALTPLAVVGDVGLVSVIAAIVGAIALSYSGASFSGP